MISFREKSLWVSLLVSAVIASIYGDSVYALIFLQPNISPSDTTALIVRITIAFIILEVALHIALAMSQQEDANTPEDERERFHRLTANNAGYWVLSVGIVSCVIQHMINSNIDFEAQNNYTNYALAPIELKLVLIFWLSEVTRFGTEIYYCRKES
ncbi:hypothetical protein R1T43_04945 [Alteromonas sp. CI.11.F.A3]|uniref:hypothetical protein n=1 Tax=unclassified Alteromonas TaxID=2614992 RepID=UPI001B39D5CA|nr:MULTISPECIES: hypothetical protein [unclassified Alteromonas]MBQ4830673.1 hypothetical protein [Alteromonas sp. MMG017]WOI38384.1 hypothetical protein R1T43_04945 [Alteromonas sp. CI.11.F.A3]